MTDQIDDANDIADLTRESAVNGIRNKAAQIPKGKPGECDLCGEYSGRLVDGACAPYRDKYKLD